MTRTLRLAPGLAALAALTVTGCSATSDTDDEPRAAQGDVVTEPHQWDMQGHSAYVLVPGRRYNLTITEPTERLSHAAASEAGISQEAPDGSAFVGIGWALEQVPSDGWLLARSAGEQPIRITLSVDDREHPLGDMRDYETRSGAWVVVPEDAQEVGVAVEFDGLTQTLEDPYDSVEMRPQDGPSLLYNTSPRLHQESCQGEELARRTAPGQWFGGDCRVRWSDPLPWMPGLGWAEEGTAWVPVDVSIDHAVFGYDAPDYVSYEDAPAERPRITVGGARPEQVLDPEDDVRAGEQDDGSWEGIAVVQVPDRTGTPEVRIRQSWTGVPEDADEAAAAGAPDPARLGVRWTSS